MDDALRSLFGLPYCGSDHVWRAWLRGRLTPLGLTEAKWLTVCALAEAGGSLPQAELGAWTGIEKPNLVKTLGELERAGLVERSVAPAGRRAKIVQLSREAGPTLAKIARWTELLLDEVLDGIPDQELAVFTEVLARIVRNIDDSAGTA